MAEVGGAALGALFGEAFTLLHEGVKSWGSKALNFSSTLKSLASNLDRLAPEVEKIKELSEELDLREDLREFDRSNEQGRGTHSQMLENQKVEAPFQNQVLG